MNSVHKKLKDLEKLKKEISEKLDKYEYDFTKEDKKMGLSSIKNDNNDKNENNNNNIMGKNYKQVIDKRLNDIMGKIDDHIINQNYSKFYKFLSNRGPYHIKKNQKNKENSENNELNKKEHEIIQNDESQNIYNNSENENKNIDNELNNESKDSEIKEEEKVSEKEPEKEKNENIISNNDNNELNELKNKKNQNIANIHISYNGGGKIDLEDFKSQQDLELLHKQQNIYLSNELTRLKCKLNQIRKDNEFLKSVINEKGMVKNTNVLEKFIGKFVERLSLNWDEIVNMIIDELLIEESYVLNEIELKKINYEKNKNILIKNFIKAGFGGIVPEDDEKNNVPNTNMDLIIGNIDFIQKMLNNVKQTEKDMKIKYNIK